MVSIKPWSFQNGIIYENMLKSVNRRQFYRKWSKWPVYGSFQIPWEKVFSCRKCTFFFIFECSDDLNCLDSKDNQFPTLLIHFSSLSTDWVCFSMVTLLYMGVHINTAFWGAFHLELAWKEICTQDVVISLTKATTMSIGKVKVNLTSIL